MTICTNKLSLCWIFLLNDTRLTLLLRAFFTPNPQLLAFWLLHVVLSGSSKPVLAWWARVGGPPIAVAGTVFLTGSVNYLDNWVIWGISRGPRQRACGAATLLGSGKVMGSRSLVYSVHPASWPPAYFLLQVVSFIAIFVWKSLRHYLTLIHI